MIIEHPSVEFVWQHDSMTLDLMAITLPGLLAEHADEWCGWCMYVGLYKMYNVSWFDLVTVKEI